MKRIQITTPTSYDIIIEPGALSRVGEFLSELYTPRKVCIIADSTAGAIGFDINKLHHKIMSGRTGTHLFELKKAS